MVKKFRKIEDLDLKYSLLDVIDFEEFINTIYPKLSN